jgi:hypothetical protein
MPAHHRRRGSGRLGQFAGSLRAGTQELDYAPARPIRQHVETRLRIHGQIIY